VIVKHARIVADDDDVIAGVAGRWPNPLRLETAVRISLEERVRQHVTRAGGEEHSVRERPLFYGIALCAWCASLVHPEALYAQANQSDLTPMLRWATLRRASPKTRRLLSISDGEQVSGIRTKRVVLNALRTQTLDSFLDGGGHQRWDGAIQIELRHVAKTE
jgi:hypothetical protein